MPRTTSTGLPFREAASDEFFFPGASPAAAEQKLGYLFEQGLGLGLVLGAPGLGKSLLLRRLTARAAAAGHAVADVFFPRLGLDDLLALLDAELTGERAAVAGRDERLRRIAERLARLTADGAGGLIVIDDAHRLRSRGVFEAFHSLLNLRQRDDARLTVVLAGEPSLAADLARVPALAQRLAVTATLRPFDAGETAGYVRHRLAAAGRDSELFTEAALSAVFEHSDGVPRAINRLCELAVVVADADGRSRIDSAAVEVVAEEFAGLAVD